MKYSGTLFENIFKVSSILCLMQCIFLHQEGMQLICYSAQNQYVNEVYFELFVVGFLKPF